MPNDTHTIRVSLDTSADPPVSLDRWELDLKNKGTHKVVWKPVDGTIDFPYVLVVRAGDSTYSTGEPNPQLEGGVPKIRNQP